jgi:hypothetical protein
MVQIRLQYEIGYLKRDIPLTDNVISILVRLRGHGLYCNVNDKEPIIWAKTLTGYCDAIDILNKI